MGSFSDYLENKILDHIFGASAYTPPETVYIALCTSAPTDASTGSDIVEATYTGYARKAVTNNKTNFNSASAGSVSNAVEQVFAECTAGSSTITHFAVLDASTGGNMLAWGALSTSKTITTGDTPKFAAGDLVATLD